MVSEVGYTKYNIHQIFQLRNNAVCVVDGEYLNGSVEPRSDLSVNFCFCFACRRSNCYILGYLNKLYYM